MSEGIEPPIHRFSWWRLILSPACFAAAAVILALCLDQTGSNNTITWTANQARALMFFLFGPAIGLLLGLGVGLVVRRPFSGALIGLLVPVLFDAAIIGYSWL